MAKVAIAQVRSVAPEVALQEIDLGRCAINLGRALKSTWVRFSSMLLRLRHIFGRRQRRKRPQKPAKESPSCGVAGGPMRSRDGPSVSAIADGNTTDAPALPTRRLHARRKLHRNHLSGLGGRSRCQKRRRHGSGPVGRPTFRIDAVRTRTLGVSGNKGKANLRPSKQGSVSMEKATKIELMSLRTVQMRTFHLTWLAFFLCFFGWFAHAPLMPATIGPDLGLSKAQKITAFMASVGVTIFARLLLGYLCDRIGPRKAYVGLLCFGALAVGGSSFAHSWETYLLSRLCIGVIGAAFVITQYHTTVMFSPKIVGLANATTAGWGNMGGGVTQAVMPMIASAMVALGFANTELGKWRPAMFVPAAIMLVVAVLYWIFTQDSPEGNYSDLKRERKAASDENLFVVALKDRRVWILCAMYAGCFGLELFVDDRAAEYFQERFHLPEHSAGMFAAIFGGMSVFARSLGGWLSDRLAARGGLDKRVRWLVAVMVCESAALILFSRMGQLSLAVLSMIILGLCVHMAAGATYAVVPFVNRQALGVSAGIVGSGGNLGAVCFAQFLLRSELPLQDVLFYLGFVVAAVGVLGMRIRFEQPVEQPAALPAAAALQKAV